MKWKFCRDGWAWKCKSTESGGDENETYLGTGEDMCNFCSCAVLYFESTTLKMSSVSWGHGTE